MFSEGQKKKNRQFFHIFGLSPERRKGQIPESLIASFRMTSLSSSDQKETYSSLPKINCPKQQMRKINKVVHPSRYVIDICGTGFYFTSFSVLSPS